MRMTRKGPTSKKRDSMPVSSSSDREVADFWETHSAADYWNELEPVEMKKHRAPRQVVTLRLDPKAVQALRALARRRGLDFSTLARSWISERLRKELDESAAD